MGQRDSFRAVEDKKGKTGDSLGAREHNSGAMEGTPCATQSTTGTLETPLLRPAVITAVAKRQSASRLWA